MADVKFSRDTQCSNWNPSLPRQRVRTRSSWKLRVDTPAGRFAPARDGRQAFAWIYSMEGP
jgi:hypothetical protein